MQQHVNPCARCCLLCKPPRSERPLQHSRLQSPGVMNPLSQAPQFSQGALGSHMLAPPEPLPWFDAHGAERSVREQACWRRVMARKGDEPRSRCSGCGTTRVMDIFQCHRHLLVPLARGATRPYSSELASKEEGGSYLGLKPSDPHSRCCAPLAIRFPVQVRLHSGVFSTLVLLLASHSILASPLLHGDSALPVPGAQVNHISLWTP